MQTKQIKSKKKKMNHAVVVLLLCNFIAKCKIIRAHYISAISGVKSR